MSDTYIHEQVVDGSETGTLRVMTKEQILERQKLNTANTTSALRARVLKETARQNGKEYKPDYRDKRWQ
jgi:hypothetical protein